ncbi:MAG TPA: hypothetical protein VKT77_10445 [Chthonomonadaceae bacterium]|nr:hypothetical protein [Chthonomonadaceae bacterium]
MSSIQTHVRVIGWLYVALGILTLLGAAVVGMVFGSFGALAAGSDTGHAGLGVLAFLGVGGFLFMLVGIFALPNLIVGWGILQGFEWARIAGIVVSFLTLIHPSFGIGTAIAIYSLIILFSAESEAYFRGA